MFGVTPKPTSPAAVTTNGVLSGLAESSTTNALPAPVWVMVRAALAELASSVVAPLIACVSVASASPRVAFPVLVRVVKVPAAGVVAPTVPLMLIEAVPVRLVTVPLAGVPRIGVEDVYAACEKIRAAGGKIVREPGPMKHGSTILAFVEDPDGYRIELLGLK